MMKRTYKLLGFALLLTAVLALAIGGTALAATRNQSKDGSCGQCVDYCEPTSHNYDYSSPGPHGFQKGKIN